MGLVEVHLGDDLVVCKPNRLVPRLLEERLAARGVFAGSDQQRSQGNQRLDPGWARRVAAIDRLGEPVTPAQGLTPVPVRPMRRREPEQHVVIALRR